VAPADLPKVLEANVDQTPEPALDPQADRLMVLSQDCDLAHDSVEAEPWAELLLIRRLDGFDKHRDNPCRHGKNPRRLVLQVRAGDQEIWHWAEPHSRFRVPRTILVGLIPDQEHSLKESQTRQVAAWITRRYTRAALADAFNTRLKAVARRLDELWKSGSAEPVSGCYVLGARDERSFGESYRIRLILAVASQAARQAEGLAAAGQVAEKLDRILGDCAGIEVEDIRVDPEEDLTLADLRHYQRMDLDYRSGADQPGAAQPVDQPR